MSQISVDDIGDVSVLDSFHINAVLQFFFAFMAHDCTDL